MKSLFYQPIRIEAKPHQVCFWSDTHFNHKCEHWSIPLWRARGFESIEEHNETLIERWNEKSNMDTTFFHLGDFVFGFNSIEAFKKIIRRVNFKHLFVMPGNHCSGWKQVFEEQTNKNTWSVAPGKMVTFVPNYLEVVVNGQMFVLSHYPILSFNGQSKGGYCLYGHVHGNLSKNEIGKLYDKAKTMEVTVESAPYPVTFADVRSYMKTKEFISFDHHSYSENDSIQTCSDLTPLLS